MSSAGLGIGAGALGAVGDLFGGFLGYEGDESAKHAFDTAAEYAAKNAQVAQRSGQIQEMQANRVITQAVGGQASDVAAAGMSGGGSNQYLMRSTVQQGGVTKSLIANQTQLQVQGFEAQEASDLGQASQVQEQADASAGSGILGAIGSIIGLL